MFVFLLIPDCFLVDPYLFFTSSLFVCFFIPLPMVWVSHNSSMEHTIRNPTNPLATGWNTGLVLNSYW